VGALANILAGANYNPQYFCNLVGSSFKPCATNAGFTGKGANTAYLKPNTTAGTFGQIFYMYGPHQTFNDMSLTKSVTSEVH
jgi:hypothetical protein